MAPEVAKRASYTRKADIWSVGCLMVEMLTGGHPWAELDQMQAILRVCDLVTTNIFRERALIEILNSLALLRSLQFQLTSLLRQLISYNVPSRLTTMLVLPPPSSSSMIGSLRALTLHRLLSLPQRERLRSHKRRKTFLPHLFGSHYSFSLFLIRFESCSLFSGLFFVIHNVPLRTSQRCAAHDT